MPFAPRSVPALALSNALKKAGFQARESEQAALASC
jgi:hypothetical protein